LDDPNIYFNIVGLFVIVYCVWIMMAHAQ